MFWIGATLPIITFFLRKKFPGSRFLHAIHWPIFFAGTGNLPPAVCVETGRQDMYTDSSY